MPPPRWPRGRATGPVVLLTFAVVAAVGAAAAFAPSWDSYTLRTSAGLTRSLTAGNSFANPAPVIAGDVAVMVALVVVVVTAVLWRPIRLGAALLAGAVIPMAAQAISALVQIGQPTSPAAVRNLTGSGRAGRAHDQHWCHAGVLDLLRLRRGTDHDVRVDADPAPPIRSAGPLTPPGSIPSPVPAAAMTAEESRDLAGTAGRRRAGRLTRPGLWNIATASSI